MSAESLVERLAEWSKKIDYVLITIGAGVFIIYSQPVGMAIIIGSVLTIIPAVYLQNQSRRRQAQS